MSFGEAAGPHHSIGGVAIGAQGSSGIYSGYTMAGGDDFTSDLDLVRVANPFGRYFPTIIYEPGARGTTGLLGQSWDNDPYNPGDQDANRGVALGSTNMSQANSVLSLLARLASGVEVGKIGSGRTLVDAIIHTGGYITASAPCVLEARVKFSSTIPAGWHPTFWTTNTNPFTTTSLSSGGNEEIDFEANTYDGSTPTSFAFNYNLITHLTHPK